MGVYFRPCFLFKTVPIVLGQLCLEEFESELRFSLFELP